MPSPVNQHAADRARQRLLDAGIDLPPSARTTSDHLTLLRYAATLESSLLAAVEAACISDPTPGAHQFLTSCHNDHKPVVIVSNNAADAVHAYLLRFRLHSLVRGVVGRELPHPELMKPHPSLVGAAIELAGRPAALSVLIGDSVTDMDAARAAGVRALGFGKTDRRFNELTRTQADAVTRGWPRRYLT